MSSRNINMEDAPGSNLDEHEDLDEYLDADDAAEEIAEDGDHPMDSGDDDDDQQHIEQEELSFENDSAAHFDHHSDSLFCIAQHPLHPSIVLSGSGDDMAYIFDSNPELTKVEDARPVLPKSYEADPKSTNIGGKKEREGLPQLLKLDGHTDSVNAVAFTQPKGEYAVTAGLDGRLRVWKDSTPSGTGTKWAFVAEAQEVEEIDWVAVCPVPRPRHQEYEENDNVVALGASDGSVWVYRIDSEDTASPISIISTFFQHTSPCTAGAWTPDGKLLATVSEEGSLYVFDVFGRAAAAGVAAQAAGTQAVVAITPQDQRFAVEGGLYSVAIAPTGSFVAVGGAEGNIRVVSLPSTSPTTTTTSSKSKSKSKPQPAASGSGTIIASLQSQGDSVETLSFSSPPLNLLAAGSVDGSIALFDTAHRFAVRRHIRSAHDDAAVVKVEFVRGSPTPIPTGQAGVGSGAVAAGAGERSWLLTSVGMDGVVRRWDTRGGTAAAGQGLIREWRGHMGISEISGGDEGGQQEGENEPHGGVLDFVQGGSGKRIVTAGDDGIALVFEE